MATLQKIRNRAGLLIIALGLALLAFIVGDGLRSGSTLIQQNKAVALRIEGQKVPIDKFQHQVNQIIENYEASGAKLTEEQRMQVNNQVAGEFVRNYAIEDIADKVGIKVSGKEYVALVTGEGLQQDQYAMQMLSSMGVNAQNPEEVNHFLSQLDEKQINSMPQEQQAMMFRVKDAWENNTARILNERLLQKYTAILSRSYAINKIDAQFLDGSPSRTVAVVRTPSTILTGDSSYVATDDQAKKYYDKHLSEFRMTRPYVQMSYVAKQILPDARDLAEIQRNVDSVYAQLQEPKNVENAIRNLENGFVYKFYLTEDELDQTGLSSDVLSFYKEANVGGAMYPLRENDVYKMAVLTGKKESVSTISAQVIILDTLSYAKADSIVDLINSGKATMSEMVNLYSIDNETKQNDGYLVMRDPRTGVEKREFTEFTAIRSGLDTLFKITPQKAVVLGQNSYKYIARIAETGPVLPKYQIAYGEVPVRFSEETYRREYKQINDLLLKHKDASFETILKEAETLGFEVVKDEKVDAASARLAAIPNSREVISWVLRGKKNDISDKLFRCGDDYLLIASIGDAVKGTQMPFDAVKQSIKDRLTMENRGDKLVENLKAKNISSLEQYATAMQASIDTVADVSEITPPYGFSPIFRAVSVATPMNKVSGPFRSETEVMVIKPISEQKDNSLVDKGDFFIQQQRAYIGSSLGNRCFQKIVSDLKVDDNRGMFY